MIYVEGAGAQEKWNSVNGRLFRRHFPGGSGFGTGIDRGNIPVFG